MAWNYVRESTPYLSKHTSFDRVFCCTSLKWWHLQMLFSFLQNFSFLGCWGKCSHCISQELYVIWLWFLVHMCKMMISPAIFFHFFKILIFQVFQSSSINAKRKFWGVPHFPLMGSIFLLNCDLSCPSWNYQGQNYQNIPQIVSQWKIVTIPIALPVLFCRASQYGLAFWKIYLWAKSFLKF